MKTIAVINQKGGVGKSTTAYAIGAGLSAKGFKVLFIDLDAQQNLSGTMKANTTTDSVLKTLMNPETVTDELQRTERGDILASSAKLSGADMYFSEADRKEYRLKDALARIEDSYDYAIIDTPPALGILTVNALVACKDVIIPAQADIYSLQGIGQLSNTISAVKARRNPALSIMGILITRYNGRSIIRKEVAEQLEETARELNTKVFESKIRECVSIVEAQAVREDIYTYAPRSRAAEDYRKLVAEILKGEAQQ